MDITVFLSAAKLSDQYVSAAEQLGRLIGEGGHTLVWGGSDVGLMKVLADSVHSHGGRLRGVSVDFLAHVVRPDVDDMVITQSLGERKLRLLTDTDAVIMMVGGTGTLDEMTDLLEMKKHRLRDEPIVILNTAGFYDGLALQLSRMESEGFLPVPLSELVHFAATPTDALDHVRQSMFG